jgi:hypothetical protein
VRWTSPLAGSCDVTGNFERGNSLDMQGWVLVNETSSYYFLSTEAEPAFPFATAVAPGDTIDFAVGPNPSTGCSYGGTGLVTSIVCE